MNDLRGHCGPFTDVVCRIMVGFISLTYNLIIHQLDIISRHFAVAFSIPIHNIGIYFDKLCSLRCLFFVLSGLLENGIFQAIGGDKNRDRSMKVRKYLGTSIFGVLCVVRIVYLLLLYTSKKLSYHIYIALCIEAVPYGIHDTTFMALASEYVATVSMFFNFCRLFIFLTQSILDMLYYSRPLFMIKIQAWICVILTSLGVGLWYYYNFNLKVKPGQPAPEQILKIVKEPPGESVFDKLLEKLLPEHYNELRELRSRAQKNVPKLEEKLKDQKTELSTEEISAMIYQDENANKNGSEDTQKLSNEATELSKPTRTDHQQMCDSRIGNDGIGAAVSPIMLYWSSSICREFLYPSFLPYGLLARDKCHLINMLIPVFNNLGPVTFAIMDNFTDKFDCWMWVFDLIWLLAIPLPIILVYVFLAIHTKIPSARAIINSRPRIMAMTLVMFVMWSYINPISYIGIGKYAFRGNPRGFTVLGFHMNAALLGSSIFSKLAVGYTDVRISLGYHLPKFRPTHKMSDANTFWYIFKNTFTRAWRDTKRDFRFDIKKYL